MYPHAEGHLCKEIIARVYKDAVSIGIAVDQLLYEGPHKVILEKISRYQINKYNSFSTTLMRFSRWDFILKNSP